MRAARLVILSILALATSACAGRLGYSMKPETIHSGRSQGFRLAVLNLTDDRPDEEKDFGERIRLIGDDQAKGYTDLPEGINGKVSDIVAKHLLFSGCFTEVGRVSIDSDEQIDLLKIDIRKLSRDYDAALIGRIGHLYGFDGTNAEGDRRIVEARADIVDIKIIRTRDLKLIWSGQAVKDIREFESNRPGNEYRIANETLRDAINALVDELGRQRLAIR